MNDSLMNDQYSLNIPMRSEGGGSSRSCTRTYAFAILMVLFLMAATGVVAALVFGRSSRVPDPWVLEYPFAALPAIPKDIVFVGHQHCDTDSLGAAIGAAALFGGSVATCTDGLNPETQFVVRKFGLTVPFMSNSSMFVSRPWGLVDVSSRGQLPEGVVDSDVTMIIDHHNLAEDLVGTKGPINGDWRPWGSASTIITFRYFESRTPLPNVSVASVLMAAIVSDTLNLKSITTTKHDKAALAYLSSYTRYDSTMINQLARDMYLAKSNVSGLSTEEIIRLDYKKFVMGNVDSDNYTAIHVGWAAAETVLTEEYIKDKEKYFAGMRAVREADKLDFIFMAPVNLESLTSFIFLCDPREATIAERVYRGTFIEPGVMDTKTLVSRKADFIPLLEGYLNAFANVGEISFGP